MTQSLVRGLALAAAIFAVTAADAHAGWYSSGGSSSGSSGGSSSSGSWGSSGGSWGSHGGGLFSRIRARLHARHSSGGSSSSHGSHGSWGSSGGSSSSHSSWGSSGGSSSSSGSWGSSGGSSSSSGGGGYVVPYAPPAENYYGDPMNPPPPPPTGGEGDATPPEPPMARADSGVLTVSVPADARVYVNGARTTSTGAWRHYVSRGLRRGYKYAYEVRAELVRDGRTIEETKTVELRAGETNRLAFDFDADETTTTLTLKVPEGAKVTLSGAETTSTGPVRTFSTTQLQPGQAWSDYVVQVSWDNNGETVVNEETITLNAGESRTLEFGGAEKIAAAR